MTTRILQNSADNLRWLFYCGIRGIAGAVLPSSTTSTRITEPLQTFLAHEQSSGGEAETSFTDPNACERELLHRQFRAFVRSCLPNEAFVAALVGPDCCLPYLQSWATSTSVAAQMQASWLPALQALASALACDSSASQRQALVDSGALVRLLVMLGDLSRIDAADDANAIGDEFRSLKAEYERLRRALDQQTYRPTTTSSGSLWASGTGYGFDDDGYYDEYDAYDEDGNPRPRHNDDAASERSKPVDHDQESRMQVLTALLEVLASWFGGAPMTAAAVASVASLLGASSLIPLFVSRFCNYSMLDMAEQLALYTALFRTMSALLQQNVWRDGQARMHELVAAVDSLRARALQVRKSAAKIRANDTMDVEDVVQSLVHLIIASHEELEPYLAALRAPARGCNHDDASVPQQDNDAVPLDGATHYIELLRELQCLEHDILSQQQPPLHAYTQQAQADGIGGALKLRRLMSELASLGTNLPLHPESSVFFRFDSERPDVCTALITGPAGTPYDGGCFHFDIYLPSSYPNSPPVVNLQTTGHGSVRFNPNLYEQGTVCLSLLGTWSGASGENWSAESSTLLQVLVSIQSLILVEQPYFNEPGYESSMHTTAGETASTNYNRTIREATVRWAMIDQLRCPARGYEQVIRTHFRLHGRHCVQVVNLWIAEAASEPTHKSALELLLGELQAELQKL